MMPGHFSNTLGIIGHFTMVLISVSVFVATDASAQGPLSSDLATYRIQLRSTDELVRKRAAEELSQFGGDALPDLKGLLSDSARQVQLAALNSIGSMGSIAWEVGPNLLELFAHPDREIRLKAADVFPGIGRNASDDLSEVIALLNDKNP